MMKRYLWTTIAGATKTFAFIFDYDLTMYVHMLPVLLLIKEIFGNLAGEKGCPKDISECGAFPLRLTIASSQSTDVPRVISPEL